MPKKAEYKPLLFTTTVRNPQRLKALLWVLKKFDGQILSDDLAIKIIAEVIRYGLYRPMKKTEDIKAKWKSSPQGEFADYILTDEEVMYILEHNPQNHKEAGFAKGFPSRFATFYDFPKELGFVYYTPNEPIFFSELGTKFAEIYSVEIAGNSIIAKEVHPEYEQQAFLQAMCKYQRNNPFVRVLNDNVPLILLLQTIKKLNEDPKYNGAGISRQELPLLIFWKDNNAEALYQRIKLLRQQYGYNPSYEVIIDICTNEIMGGGFKKFEPKSIINEYPDEFIRKMRLTGLISLRGAGRLIDINHMEDEKVAYVLSHYATYSKYHSERAYFDYMATIDSRLFNIHTVEITPVQSETLLMNWLDTYKWNSIKNELHNLAERKASKDEVLKFLPNPVRLEFLTALAVKSKLPAVRVIPNYTCDDTGLPTSTAGGNKGDIECIEHPNTILLEVTMAEGRTQTTMEIWPIARHLEEFKGKYEADGSQCVFVAPTIFTDSYDQIDWVKDRKKLTIRPYKIAEFVSYLESSATLYQF